jgi:hypothetical protein
MAFGQVTVSLRPIKFAFLVDPADPKALREAIRLSLFLWGGIFNPLIPTFRQTPANWSDIPPDPPIPQDIVAGYVRLFDPDVIVACGDLDPSSIPELQRGVVQAAEIIAPVAQDGVPACGVGLFEILSEVAEREFKFTRRDNLQVFVPSYTGDTEPFLAALFGDQPPQAPGTIYEDILRRVDTHRPTVAMDNFLDFHSGSYLFRHELCNFGLDIRRPRAERHDTIFYLNHDDPLDVMDFWNLRAVGWDVLPIPKIISQTETAKTAAREFISNREDRDVQPPRVGNRVTILKSRSISQEDHRAFVESLRQDPSQIMLCQNWYPHMWDEFTHVRGRVRCSQLVAEARNIQITDETASLRIPALAPEFMAKIYRGRRWRYANDLTISIYGSTDFRTAVIPPDQQSVSRLFGLGLSDQWRIGPGGVTFLGALDNWVVDLQQPDPRDVASSVLASKGWQKFAISSAGNIAYQMVRHLGGPHAIGLLRSRLLIEYLECLSQGVGRYDLAETFFAQMNRINESSLIKSEIPRLVRRYTDAKIFTLGIEVQCPVCTQHSWHAADAIRYDIQCQRCLSQSSLPIHDPRTGLKWAYKAHGPFAAPKRGGGSYSALLSVDFLSSFHHPATSTCLSFTAKSSSGRGIEADFMMFYRGSAFWESEIEWIFGECKTFNAFKQEDIDRMQVVADHFPNGVIVFSTLRDQFSQEEKDILTPFVERCRAYGKLDRPRNPVLLLTGTELFAGSLFGPPRCWGEKGGRFAAYANISVGSLLALCEITQSLYLDLGGWGEDWDVEFARRLETAGVQPNDQASASSGDVA